MSNPIKVTQVMKDLRANKEVSRMDISQAMGYMQYVFNKKTEQQKHEEASQADNIIKYLKGKLC